MTAGEASHRRRRHALAGPDLDRLAWPGLVLVVIASGLLLMHLTRGSSFWADDWLWIVNRRGNTVNAFLAPYNGHLSLVPVAIYRLMFAAFGIRSYTPYRALAIALSLVVAVTVFVYARRRTGELVALLAAASMLFLGPGWQDTMWGFQTPWLMVCTIGIVALMLLERRTTRADAGASILILLAICSTSLGLAFAVGIIVDLALTRHRWRDVWIWAVPLALYAVWVVGYRPNSADLGQLPAIPLSIAQSAAASLSTLSGVSGIAPFQSTANSLTYGWPLLVAAGIVAVWCLRHGHLRPRAVSLTVIFVVFTGSISIAHFELSSPLASRYLYVDCLLALLLAVELAAGARQSRAAQLALMVVTAAAIVGNVGALRTFGAYFRGSGQTTDGALTALDLDRGSVNPHTVARIALWQFVSLDASSYYAADRALGSPAYTVAQLPHATGLAQSAADAQLLADGDVTFASTPRSTPPTPPGAPPAVVASPNGTVARDGVCLRFTPSTVIAPGAGAALVLRIDGDGLSVTSGGAPATLSVRRFAASLMRLGTLAAQQNATVTVRHDVAPEPWYLQLSSIAPMRVCRLS